MDLYHVRFGLPTDRVRLPVGIFQLIYSKHAQEAAADDYYSPLNLPALLNAGKARIIEVGVEDGSVVHALYRIRYAHRTDVDLCLAVVPVKGKMLVKTVWSQDVDDDHATLRPRRYVNAPA